MVAFKKYQTISLTKIKEEDLMWLYHHMKYMSTCLCISNSDGYKMVRVSEISYIKSDSNYSTIVLKNGDQLCTSKTLKYWQTKVNSNYFLRCHNSYLINIQYIEKLDKASGNIVINGTIIPISRSKKTNIINLITL